MIVRGVRSAVAEAIRHPAFPEVVGRNGGGDAENDKDDQSSFHERTGLNERVA